MLREEVLNDADAYRHAWENTIGCNMAIDELLPEDKPLHLYDIERLCARIRAHLPTVCAPYSIQFEWLDRYTNDLTTCDPRELVKRMHSISQSIIHEFMASSAHRRWLAEPDEQRKSQHMRPEKLVAREDRVSEAAPVNSRTTETPSTLGDWASHRNDRQLRDKSQLLTALNAPRTRARWEALKRLNRRTGGPMVLVNGRYEADEGELLAWHADAEGKARALLERQKERVTSGRQLMDAGVFQRERRPNSKSKARPAPQTL